MLKNKIKDIEALKTKSTLKNNETHHELPIKKDWRRFFRKAYYENLINNFLVRFVKNENETIGVFFLKRHFLLFVCVFILFVADILFWVFIPLALVLFAPTFLPYMIVLLILVWFFANFYALIKVADKYSYRLQIILKQVFITLALINFTNTYFYANDVRVPILTLRHKSIQFLENTFREYKVNDKRLFCLKYVLKTQGEVKNVARVEFCSSTQAATKSDLLFFNSRKESLGVLWPFKKPKKEKVKKPIKPIIGKEESVDEKLITSDLLEDEEESKQPIKPTLSRKKVRNPKRHLKGEK